MTKRSRPQKLRGKTLRDVAAAKAALQATCRRCRHRTVLYPADLAARLGADFEVDGLAERLRCTNPDCRALGMASVIEVMRDGPGD